jgi:hypothetical protein
VIAKKVIGQGDDAGKAVETVRLITRQAALSAAALKTANGGVETGGEFLERKP